MLTFVRPHDAHREAVLSFYSEFEENRETCIGYAVRPSRRNHGLATQILRQGLDLAEQLGFQRVLCVCDDDNAASEKVILRNGGVFENTLFDANEHVFVKRYWIDL